MADFIDDSIKIALGSNFVKKIDKMQAKQDKMQQEVSVIDDNTTELKEKASFITSIKQISESQGKPVTSKEVVDIVRSLATTITQRVEQLSLTTTKQLIQPVQQISQIEKLLSSNQEEDQDRAFDMIDKLQERLGVDLSKFSKDISSGIQKLYEINKNKKQEKADEKERHDKKIQELTTEQDILKQRNIITFLDEKNEKLHMLTNYEEKILKEEIIKEEKEIAKEKRRLLEEEKRLKRQTTIDENERKKYVQDIKTVDEAESRLNKVKQGAGLKTNEIRPQGTIERMFRDVGSGITGQFSSIKDVFGRDGQIGGLVTDIKNLGGAFKGLGKILDVTIMPILRFLGIILMTLISTIMSGIMNVLSFLGKGIGGVGRMLFGGGKAAVGAAGAGTAVAGGIAAGGAAATYGATGVAKTEEGKKLANQVNEETDRSGFSMTGAMDGDLAMGTILANPETIKPLKDKKELPKVNQSIDLNKLSTQAASEPSTKTNNVVPIQNNSISNVSSGTTVMTPEPYNLDRSFQNLSTVVV